MKTFSVIALLTFSFILSIGCSRNNASCNCQEAYQQSIQYYPGDYAWHNNICWYIPEVGGKGVEPGSMYNDVWEICSE